jgi:hypothetical protein
MNNTNFRKELKLFSPEKHKALVREKEKCLLSKRVLNQLHLKFLIVLKLMKENKLHSPE